MGTCHCKNDRIFYMTLFIINIYINETRFTSLSDVYMSICGIDCSCTILPLYPTGLDYNSTRVRNSKMNIICMNIHDHRPIHATNSTLLPTPRNKDLVSTSTSQFISVCPVFILFQKDNQNGDAHLLSHWR